MLTIYVPKEKMPLLIGRIMDKARVFAPVKEGDTYRFRLLDRPDKADLSYQNTRLSPKELMHPQQEAMFRFSLKKGDPKEGILAEIPKDLGKRVVWGLRPCDAKAFQLVDVNFVTEQYVDPWWRKRRQATVLVGLGCHEPCSTCFCTSVGTGPFDRTALDVLMTELPEGYLLEAVTESGQDLLADIEEGRPADEDIRAQAASIAQEAERSLPRLLSPEPLRDKPMTELFQASFWEEVQFACINCGTCTFLCPTCWCFDIQDEVYQHEGVRLRLWDACMFPLFTLHGSGHNPRNQKLQRVRQRFMHKFKYYVDKYGNGPACVGCGRCVQYCPVNIDIRRVAGMMAASCVCPT
ncbi:MAG: 4Fe-4S dicluster domain-containing protein [Desulfosoma sp.]